MTKVKFTKPLDRTSKERVEAEQELPPEMTEEQFFKENPSYFPEGADANPTVEAEAEAEEEEEQDDD